MTIVLPHGVLFRGGEEKEIRKNLIERNDIDCIIGLPANIFFGTGIPTIIMVLRKNRKNTDIQIIDASKGFIKEGKNNKLRACDIRKIVDAVIKREDTEKFSRIVSREEIRENDYNLNIPRYVDSSNEAERWDIYATMFGGIPNEELKKFNKYWDTLPNLKGAIFSKISEQYSELLNDDVNEFVKDFPDIKKYNTEFNNSFNDFDKYISNELLENINEIDVSNEELVLANNIFDRLKGNLLIDKYHAYQLLDDEWMKISSDIEIIKTEGFETIKKVDPNIVLKKKNGKEEETQEGFIGHILPFEIVQKSFFNEQMEEVKLKENRLQEISGEYEEIIDSLQDDEKMVLLNDVNDAFVTKEISKKAKNITSPKEKYDDDSIEAKILKVNNLQGEEKQLKKDIKKKYVELQEKSKKKIESLTNEEIYGLLHIKWIEPIIQNIYKLPIESISVFLKDIQSLSEKYKSTFSDIESQMVEVEKELSSMIDELEGNEFDMKGLSELQTLLNGE